MQRRKPSAKELAASINNEKEKDKDNKNNNTQNNDEEDDGKLAADLEFRIMAMNLAAKEQKEYCSKYEYLFIYIF